MQTGVLQLSGIDCRYMVPESLMVQKNLKYVDVFGLIPLIDRLSYSQDSGTWDPVNLLIIGPKGSGKTLFLSYIAEQEEIPFLSVDCTEETRERHIKGGFIAKSGETPYVLGAISNAIQVANEVGSAILVFEELNALSPQLQKALNPITDFRKKIELPELSATLTLQTGARLFVAATMNPSVYGTTYEVNDDLKSRFVELEMPYPPPASERHILRQMAPPSLAATLNEDVLTLLVNIANETRQGVMGYEISTRDLVQTLGLLPRVGWNDALFLLAQKFTGEDRQLFITRVADITHGAPIHADMSFRAGLRTRP